MNSEIFLSASTAFVIAGGGALLVVLGSQGPTGLNKVAVIMSCIIGLTSAAKDIRSLKKMPPVPDSNDKDQNKVV